MDFRARCTEWFWCSFFCFSKGQFSEQNQENDTFHRLTVVSAQSFLVNEHCPDAGINFRYLVDNNSQANGQSVCCFRHLAIDDFLQTYITQKDFITSNHSAEDNPGEMLIVFDFRLHLDYFLLKIYKTKI